MDEYYYVYIDSLQTLHLATSMPFVAKHTKCRAIPKEMIPNDTLISDLLYYLNYGTPTQKELDIIEKTSIHELMQ